ncbi:HU family DNA-binding protein [Planctomycetota bacterium]
MKAAFETIHDLTQLGLHVTLPASITHYRDLIYANDNKKGTRRSHRRKDSIQAYTVKTVIQLFLNEITAELAHDNRLEFRGFGVFESHKRAARTGQNPRGVQKLIHSMNSLLKQGYIHINS